ncbi:hypothetical protein A3D66_02005 [Candidatus Kaiserbacteria bacterium RIFCSPHIGHO2_02_FULL_50_9]|uniref:Uncharacterized protein n=1 Tax=Candidatus Kaiserbacteria bacterium RIFCSPLOWO2_01_FULL_51_21 TaxID=1798508 RepID=A0A1F6EE06_9BACT|nr:MAG: hypothetical protein A2761_00090 [Candidatus Kaiserbacteria bacterium RIFCSPHIGHO2_01_FULL_51_33]OGG63627.1 MAG: hypothetical protein A3D66_02005 [Candidatus Kaiserbacteria bacterium RIFCSPHIGHO2_02_FULL_50_9]OGG71893.1 MAG: hypothetical protein A3A35_03200 [Candidatus Kaiserbacteria bacterium RIFCSPLOWO2_01_FULL_51_21]
MCPKNTRQFASGELRSRSRHGPASARARAGKEAGTLLRAAVQFLWAHRFRFDEGKERKISLF